LVLVDVASFVAFVGMPILVLVDVASFVASVGMPWVFVCICFGSYPRYVESSLVLEFLVNGKVSFVLSS
jgi:hypothetical protein